jgi:CRP-like cAMP-binding protein
MRPVLTEAAPSISPPAVLSRESVPSPQSANAVNRLLEPLPENDLRRMLAGCETVALAFSEVLYLPTERLGHVYFPTSSFISLVMPVDRTDSLEVGLIGNEGMFGVPLALGVDASPVGAVVRGAGAALRMDAALFSRELGRSDALQRTIDRYAFVHLSQLAQAAACTRFHVVEARLARWLLMTQDRARTSTFHVTQEFLALMLGVRRVGVTKAASSLQRRGLIKYNRGDITVLDRCRLEAASCGCYDADRDHYDRMFGASPAGWRDRRPPPEPNAMAGGREAAGVDAAIP